MKRIASLILFLCVFSLAAVAAASQSKSGAEQNTPEADAVRKSTPARMPQLQRQNRRGAPGSAVMSDPARDIFRKMHRILFRGGWSRQLLTHIVD